MAAQLRLRQVARGQIQQRIHFQVGHVFGFLFVTDLVQVAGLQLLAVADNNHLPAPVHGRNAPLGKALRRFIKNDQIESNLQVEDRRNRLGRGHPAGNEPENLIAQFGEQLAERPDAALLGDLVLHIAVCDGVVQAVEFNVAVGLFAQFQQQYVTAQRLFFLHRIPQFILHLAHFMRRNGAQNRKLILNVSNPSQAQAVVKNGPPRPRRGSFYWLPLRGRGGHCFYYGSFVRIEIELDCIQFVQCVEIVLEGFEYFGDTIFIFMYLAYLAVRQVCFPKDFCGFPLLGDHEQLLHFPFEIRKAALQQRKEWLPAGCLLDQFVCFPANPLVGKPLAHSIFIVQESGFPNRLQFGNCFFKRNPVFYFRYQNLQIIFPQGKPVGIRKLPDLFPPARKPLPAQPRENVQAGTQRIPGNMQNRFQFFRFRSLLNPVSLQTFQQAAFVFVEPFGIRVGIVASLVTEKNLPLRFILHQFQQLPGFGLFKRYYFQLADSQCQVRCFFNLCQHIPGSHGNLPDCFADARLVRMDEVVK